MNRRRFSTIVFVLLLTILSASAQENTPRQIYEQAEAEYNIGRILIAKNMLKDCVHDLSGTYRLGGYRLLSLCCLALDQFEEAHHYAELVLKENPYYTPTVEYPPRFLDLIKEIKQGRIATITTASSQSESINEAPVPITIITAEMIEELGYNKNLNQILAAYVPGMTEVTAYDPGENLAMHGAYGNDQELILIMENGHRLNNRYSNVGATGYSVSTEKIDHIEVLRGPASSLYGNVALSAVVNIITKSGRSINGGKVRYGYGSYTTHKADFLLGTQFMDADITVWASIYNSDGQIRHFSDGEGYYADLHNNSYDFGFMKQTYGGPDRIYVGSYRDTPSYDFGVTFKLKGLNLMFSRKNTKKLYQTSYNSGYDYSLYPSINGIKPGYGTEETHAELAYSHQLGRIALNASIYGDWFSVHEYEANHDYLKTETPAIDDEGNHVYDADGQPVIDTVEAMGESSYDNYQESTLGGSFKLVTDYRLGTMKGSLLIGSQYEHFSLHSRFYFTGENFEAIDFGKYIYEDAINKGKEDNLSFFVQDKHRLLPELIMNVGLRYDLKYRKEDNVTALSPRLALMYIPTDRFSLRLSYSEAFADLAFFYRYLFDDVYETNPLRLSSVQLSAMGRIVPLHLDYEVNVFYNKYTNLMRWNTRFEDLENGNIVKNQGNLKNMGVEATARYAHQRLSAYLSAYYCHDISSEYYYYNRNEKIVTGVPHFTLNLHGAYKLLQTANHELKFYGHASYEGRKLNYTNKEATDFYVDGTMLFDLGMKYGYRNYLQLSLDCENILNTDRYLCGSYLKKHPIFQRGRTLMASISFNF